MKHVARRRMKDVVSGSWPTSVSTDAGSPSSISSSESSSYSGASPTHYACAASCLQGSYSEDGLGFHTWIAQKSMSRTAPRASRTMLLSLASVSVGSSDSVDGLMAEEPEDCFPFIFALRCFETIIWSADFREHVSHQCIKSTKIKATTGSNTTFSIGGASPSVKSLQWT